MVKTASSEGVESPIQILRRHVAAELTFSEGVEQSLVRGADLTSIGKVLGSRAVRMGFETTPFGARGVYASALAESAAMAQKRPWFQIRENPKGHGTQRLTEGARIQKGQEVVIVDTLTTSGSALLRTILDVQEHTGARVVGAMPLVDAEEGAKELLTGNVPGLRFNPLFTKRQIENR